VDALRGIAVLMVLAYHNLSPYVIDQSGKNPVLYWAGFPILLGYSGVHLFLVLSGFCIHLRFARQRPPRRIDFGAFWRRRIRRLYPPYVAALLLSVAVVMATAQALPGPHPLPVWYPGWRVFGLDVTAHLFMLQVFRADWFAGLYNGPLWSLALEEQLYALYAPLLRLRRYGGWERMLGATLAVSILWRAAAIFNPWHRCLPLLPPMNAPHPWTFDLARMLPLCLGPARWFEWALGALAAEAYCGNVALPRWSRSPLLGVLSLAAAAPAMTNPLGWIVNDALFAGGYFVLLNALCRREKEHPEALRENRAIAALAGVGLWSYSLYLVHAPVLRATHNLLDGSPFGDRALLHATLPIAAALGAGRLFFLAVERRFLFSSPATGREEKEREAGFAQA
jgi:peptidoglycan/LPS O-acetylase OafA/YrhL